MALPSLGGDLGLSTVGLEWVASSYVLAFAALLLPGGSLVDRYGRRRVLLTGLVVFGLASVASGLAQDGAVLVAARATQGAGAALVLPASLAVVTSDLGAADRQRGAALWTAANAVALALGPLIGGLLTQHTSWRWLFLLHLPLVAVAVLLTGRLPAGAADGDVPRLDLPGLLLSAAAVGALTWALIEGQHRGWLARPVLGALTAGLALAAGFAAVERRVPAPVLDRALLRDRAFRGGTAAQVLWGLGISGVLFFTSLLLQEVLGLSPTAAGACFLPLAGALLLVVPLSGTLADRSGVHRTVGLGLLLVAAGLLLAARIGPGDGLAQVLPGMVLVGAGTGLTTPLVAHVLAGVPERRRGSASALMSSARELSAALGIAITGAVVLGRQQAALGAGAAPDVAFAAGYSRGLLVAATLVLVGAVLSVRTLRPDPAA